MHSILEAMYQGNIYPDELIVPKGIEYRGLSNTISQRMKQWKEKLSTEDFKELEELIDLRNDLNSIQSRESFVHGFKLGSLMIIEIYTNTEQLVRSR